MLKVLCFSMALTLISVNSSPVGLGTLQFDNLDSDIEDLSYDVEEEDLDDYAKLIDRDTSALQNVGKNSVKSTGFKKKNSASNGKNGQHAHKNIKKIFKEGRAHDHGEYDDDDEYASAEAGAALAVGIKGNEERKYKKGTKTRGFHRVHHKDEYKKDKEFYEDDEVKGSIKKIGAKGHGAIIEAGSNFHKGHFNHDHRKGLYGKRGYLDKGLFDKQFKEYSNEHGYDGTFSSEK